MRSGMLIPRRPRSWPRAAAKGWLALAVLAAPAVHADDELAEPSAPQGSSRFFADVTYAYLTGDYATGVTTDIQVLAPRVRWLGSRGELRLTVPFVSTSNQGNVVLVGGLPVAPGLSNQLGSVPGVSPVIPTTVKEEPARGVGDAKLRGELFFVQGSATRPWLSGVAEVKAPTGSASDGLGTGKYDTTGGVGFLQPVGRVNFLADATYTWVGDPTGVELRNVVDTGAGIAVRVGARAGSYASLYFDNRTNPVPGLEDRRDLALGAIVQFGRQDRLRFAGTVVRGLTSTADRFGVSVSLGGTF